MSRRPELKQVRRLSGFGSNAFGDGYVFQPTTVEEIQHALMVARNAGLKVVLRGSGRSYGDPSMGQEAVTLDLTHFNQIVSWDANCGLVTAQAGATLEQLWRHSLPDGYWLPVTSGTMVPTLAGALAMNIHGKNNFAAGTLGEHIVSLDVLLMNGETVTLTPSDDLFRAVISGAGLLGIILGATLKMHRVDSPCLEVVGQVANDLAQQFQLFEEYESRSDYMVSWVDCFGGGRGLFHSANYAPSGDTNQKLELPTKILGVVPKSQVWRILRLFNNRPMMKLLNAVKHHTAKLTDNGKPHFQSLIQFSYLLDYVPGWQKSYRHGFHQFQVFVPKEYAQNTFRTLLEMQKAEGFESFLGVMKRHRSDDFLLSHGVDGYSLAMDFQITSSNRERLDKMLRDMAEVVLANEGRFYLAKDSVLTADQYQRSIGPEALATFRKWRESLDPEHLLESDMARRLGL